ncbi:21 kDa protein-like [Chenopodium quinoa]|uniref:Pectinesterase inhibitor domain-containing protein n=1 Tax=Chenopodium quinoa TaxID=63459 RepID=A0A803MTV5_CHEQI|nr:21 kDa protein-like [Chenopodium quinoa]
MATLTLPFLILSILSIATFAASAAATSTNNFIKTKCSSTAYPTVCVQSLSSYANKIQKSPRQLAQTALIVSLAKAHYAKAYVAHLAHSSGLRPKESGSVKDCLEVIGDTVDKLSKSVHEFQTAVRGRSRDFLWHMSNVQTWASAALTNENTCVDGFKDQNANGKVQNAIEVQLKGVMQCTSNALALVNQFANSKYFPNNV